ncbi:glutaredoxin [Stappia indica]|uniref:Glutaredoxin n=1 Tax=Stappia indica TaxID=538381 RepID=A0A857CER3_9HYPH|nr:glutaredoxin [Stappia indica]
MARNPVKHAVLYRMATPELVCGFGTKALELLRREGYEVEEHILKTHNAVDAFKAEHRVETTPQTFIGVKRIGGHDDLVAFFREARAARGD